MSLKSIFKSHFDVFRVSLSLFLVIQLSFYLVHAEELFSDVGVFFTPVKQSMFLGIYSFSSAPIFVKLSILVMIFMAVCLALDWKRTWMALLLWVGATSLVARDPFVANVSAHYIGWLLLACALLPKCEDKNYQQILKLLREGAWLILGLTYFISGVNKLLNSSWEQGNALIFLLQSPIARNSILVSAALHIESLLKVGAWCILLFQIAFLPLVFFKRYRWLPWLVLTLMHLSIAILTKMSLLSAGVLIFHFFVFDQSWLKSFKNINPV